jgi:glycosyltransferase involved in cell wall biosynthesis
VDVSFNKKDLEKMSNSIFSVTVVIPTTGRESLQRALDSILNQTLPVNEILIVCNGCQIDDINILDSKKIPIRILYSSRQGASAARNIGIREATSKYIALLDDDDYWLPTKIEKQIKFIEENLLQDRDVLITTRALLQTKGNIRISANNTYLTGSVHENIYKCSWKRVQVSLLTPTLLFSKDLALKVPFNEDFEIREDIDFLIRLQQKKMEIFQISTPLAVVSVNFQRSWERETVKRYLGWIKYLARINLKSAFAFGCGVGFRTLFLKFARRTLSVIGFPV